MSELLKSTAQQIVEFAAIYWVHSTAILLLTWFLMLFVRQLSGNARQKIWQVACLAGLLTAGVLTAGRLTDDVQLSVARDENISEAEFSAFPQTNNTVPTTEIQSRDPVGTKAVPPDQASVGIPGNSISQTYSSDPYQSVRPETGNQEQRVFALQQRTLRKSDDATETLGNPIADADPTIPMSLVDQEWTADAALADVNNRSQDETGERWWTEALTMGVSSEVALPLAGILVAWMLAGLLFVAMPLIRLFRQSRSFVACDDVRLLEIFNNFLSSRKIRKRIQLMQSDLIDQPMACGWIRKRIVLNPGVADQLNDQEFEGLIAHEVAHLVRGDWFWLVVGRLFCTCFAFQPLNFLARNRWMSAGEEACDQWAVHSGVQPLTLAKCLTKVAEWQNSNRVSISLSVSGSSSVVFRVESLLRSGEGAIRRSRLSTLLAAGLVVGSMTALACVPLPRMFDPTEAKDQVFIPEGNVEPDSQNHSQSTPIPEHDNRPEQVGPSGNDAETNPLRFQNDPELAQQWTELNREINELKTLIEYAETVAPKGRPEISEILMGLRQRFQSLDSRRENLLNQF